MIQWGRRINSRTYDVFRYLVVIVGLLLLISGIFILLVGLIR